jgi:branched-chain amino acid transport system permease protein
MSSQLIVIIFDGLALGMLLFVMSVGLTVTLGLMNLVNLAHGVFGMLGGYATVLLMQSFNFPFLATLPFSFLSAAILGMVLEFVLFRRLYGTTPLNQVLLTIGLVFVATATAVYLFGTSMQAIELPDYFRGSVELFGLRLGVYRLFIIAVALSITIILILGLEMTRFGTQVRAAVDNQRVALGLGIDVNYLFAITFAIGSGLAGLGGALAVDIVGLDPSFAFHNLIYVLIVVAVGGLGSIKGSFAAAALIGVCDVMGKYYIPEIGSFLIYLLLIGILSIKPMGLFGARQ